MAEIDNLSNLEVRRLIRAVEPHFENGEPMVACHFLLWKRVCELADPLCTCGLNASQHDGTFDKAHGCSEFSYVEP